MNKRRLRILWCSNAFWSSSGYGQQTEAMYKSFRENGWTPDNFAMIDMFGLTGGKIVDDYGYTHYPLMNHMMGSDAMVWHSKDFKADVVISLFDIWPQNPQDLAQVNRFIPWAPVDYDPVPKAITNNLRFANRIISMSQFGERELRDKGFSSTYIPHGVDTKIFHPLDKVKRKQELKLDPNMFIFGMVSANKEAFNPRKSFQEAMEAFALFLKKRPNSLLYIHTDPEFPGGWPLKQFAEHLGISQHVAFPEMYLTKYKTGKENMNMIYNTFDCLLSPSSSEGFCIPVIEAQACGIPVIVNDWTSMPELIQEGKTGYKVKVAKKIYYPIGSYLAFPDTQDIYEKMLQVANYKTEKWAKPCRDWAVSQYDQDMLFKTRWLPFLDQLESEIYPTPQLTTIKK